MWFLAAIPSRAGDLAGHKLLVTSVRTGDTEVFEVDPETGDARNITRSARSEDRYPCWSPDGKRIAFTFDRQGGTFRLYVCDAADGSNVRQLTHETWTAVAYMPSWVGDRIVFGLHREKPEMASIRPDGSEIGVLDPGPTVGGVEKTGWIDLLTGINAYRRRSNGEYLVFVEEDYRGKCLIYRWRPSH